MLREAFIVGLLIALPAVAGTLGEEHPLVGDRSLLTHEPLVPIMEAAAQDLPPGIRPGAWMEAPHSCTLSFVVKDATTGDLFITTAGHCVDFVGQKVKVYHHGEIGIVEAFRFDERSPYHDYALVRLHPSKYAEVNPRMAGWGGPTGLFTDERLEYGALLKHYGFGSATWYNHETRCRVAVVDGASEEIFWYGDDYVARGVALWGDSGSGIMTADGLALGFVNHLDYPGFGGTRFDVALRELSKITGLTLELVTGGPVEDTCSHT